MRSAKNIAQTFRDMSQKIPASLFSIHQKSFIYLLYNDGFTTKHKASHLCFLRLYSKRKFRF